MALALPFYHFSQTRSQLLATHNVVLPLAGFYFCIPEQEARSLSLALSDSRLFMSGQIVPYEASRATSVSSSCEQGGEIVILEILS